MTRTIKLSDELSDRLVALGGGLFSEVEVIARLLDRSGEVVQMPAQRTSTTYAPRQSDQVSSLRTRAPRERGATVEVEGKRIHAGTVSDLYEQVFRLILNNGKADALKALVPFRTSNQRYLIAREPKHPNGNSFFVDVKVGPYHVEAHKNYVQAIKQLADVLARLGVDFKYIG
jgi:hypothetical protein